MPAPQAEPPTRRQQWTICILLGAAVLAVFWPALRCGFVEFDDYTYVTANPAVQHGLTWDSAKWAFTATHAGYWLPLTWLSHMADCQIYGLRPAGHHLTSLLWHAANSVLLFLVLRRLTGAFWRSAMVAALFAWHPAHVESVAWIAERKDVLSAFFWMLAMWAYLNYAGKGGLGRYFLILMFHYKSYPSIFGYINSVFVILYFPYLVMLEPNENVHLHYEIIEHLFALVHNFQYHSLKDSL